MTKDLALLVGAEQKWLSTTGFLDKIDDEPEEGDGGSSAAPTANWRRRCSIPSRASIAKIADRKDLLMDIGTEELSHLEIVGCSGPAASQADEIRPRGGGGRSAHRHRRRRRRQSVQFAWGIAWTADYLKITGELDVDLRSNIAAEARAKIVYERLINFCDDAGTKDALQFLMTREITHMKAFTAALESMEKPPFSIGKIAPTPDLVDQYLQRFHRRRATTARSMPAAHGTRAATWEFVESPAFQEIAER